MTEVMYDSIEIDQIPADAAAVAGYVGGRWPTFPTLAAKFPNADRLSIAVFANEDADCLDVEKGDATPDQAPAWVKRQLARGVRLPVIYTSVSQAPQILAVLKASGVDRSAIRLWTAHYTYKSHLCSVTCGYGFTGIADATQWNDKALGRNLDQSLVSSAFFAPDRKAASVLKAETGYWAWVQWRLGEGDWKGWGSANPAVRPNVDTLIPFSWWVALQKFLAARIKL